MTETVPSVRDRVWLFAGAMTAFLAEKNRRYGDSALNPARVFSRAEPAEGILIRLDDKLGRIRNTDSLRKNDIIDMLGYLVLLWLARGRDEPDSRPAAETGERIAHATGQIAETAVVLLDHYALIDLAEGGEARHLLVRTAEAAGNSLASSSWEVGNLAGLLILICLARGWDREGLGDLID